MFLCAVDVREREKGTEEGDEHKSQVSHSGDKMIGGAIN